MTEISDIKWGSYKQWEGPFYPGKCKYVLPENPLSFEKLLAVVCSTEGGAFDAWNGYDVCGWTSGLIQFCERSQFSVSDMLGFAIEANGDAIADPVHVMAALNHCAFRKNARGRYRFHFDDHRGEVDRKEEQDQLFYLTGDGTKGTWTDEAKENARNWAAAFSTVWENPRAQKAQLAFTARQLRHFAYGTSKAVVEAAPGSPLGDAFRAAYYSFAGNNPLRAAKHLDIAMAATKAPIYSHDWLVDVLRELTFGPNIAIYPHRYSTIRPVIERVYGVDLPDMADDLRRWRATTGAWEVDTKDLQRALIALSYDLGPAGADGVYGKKTKDAILTFEQLNQVPNPDGYPDPIMMQRLEGVLESRGLAALLAESS